MAVKTVPYVVAGLSHPAELFRREMQSGLPFGSAGGVVPATATASANVTAGVAGCSDLKVSAPASGMSVNIAAGQIYVPGSLGSGSGYGIGIGYGMPTVTFNGGAAPTVASASHAAAVQLTTQGAYYCYNDNSSGAVNLAVAAANASNPRIDVVIAQVEDATYSGAANDWKLAVVTGTAAASPAAPALPANSAVLAYVWIPAASTSVVAGNILDLRVAYNRNPFTARAHRAGAWTTAGAGAYGTFLYDTIDYDPTGMYNSGTGNFTVPVSGLYQVTSKIRVLSNAANQIIGLAVFKNGAEYAGGHNNLTPITATNLDAPLCVEVLCSAGDVLTVRYLTSTNGLTGDQTSTDNYSVVTLRSPI